MAKRLAKKIAKKVRRVVSVTKKKVVRRPKPTIPDQWAPSTPFIETILTRYDIPFDTFLIEPNAKWLEAVFTPWRFLFQEPMTEVEMGLRGMLGAYQWTQCFLFFIYRIPYHYKPLVHKLFLQSPSKQKRAQLDRIEQEMNRLKMHPRRYMHVLHTLPYSVDPHRFTPAEFHKELHRRTREGQVVWKAIVDQYAENKGLQGIQPVELLGWTLGYGASRQGG